MRSFALHNLKGGVGKTTTAVNLAWLAAREKKRTLLWDLDPQGAAGMYVGVGPGVPGGAKQVVRGENIETAVKPTRFENLDVLPADLSLRLLDVELDHAKKPGEFIARIFAEVGADYDVIVLDAPPGLGLLTDSILNAVDALLVPIVPSPLGIYVYERMVAHLLREDCDLSLVPAFFSMVDRRRKIHRELVEKYAGKQGSYLACTIPAAAEIEKMGLHHAPLGAFASNSVPARAFAELWSEMRARIGVAPPAPVAAASVRVEVRAAAS